MFRSSCTVAAFAAVFTVGTAALSPATARAEAPAKTTSSVRAASAATKTHKTARIVKAHACVKPPVEIAAGAETATVSLVDCQGSALPAGVDELSVLARPGSAPKPKEKTVVASRSAASPNVAPGIRRMDARLVERLELVVDHFAKEGHAPRVELVSGYRPKSEGSFHQTGRALDFKLDGVKNEDVVAFCKTLPDTGCGYYPNSSFVHIDARAKGAGHISWIDTSRPGEPPSYVTSWPPTSPTEAPAAAPEPPALSLPALPADEPDLHGPPPSRKRTWFF
jgi:hypothetical protein